MAARKKLRDEQIKVKRDRKVMTQEEKQGIWSHIHILPVFCKQLYHPSLLLLPSFIFIIQDGYESAIKDSVDPVSELCRGKPLNMTIDLQDSPGVLRRDHTKLLFLAHTTGLSA